MTMHKYATKCILSLLSILWDKTAQYQALCVYVHTNMHMTFYELTKFLLASWQYLCNMQSHVSVL